MTILLKDCMKGKRKSIPVTIREGNNGIYVCPNECSYSDAPIRLEIWKGELRLIVWADKATDEPTHIIKLEDV